jgi:hypothetical protein
MSYGDIDDLLINIDDNSDENLKSGKLSENASADASSQEGASTKETEKSFSISDYHAEVAKERQHSPIIEQKDNKIPSGIHNEDLSFLDNIDSDAFSSEEVFDSSGTNEELSETAEFEEKSGKDSKVDEEIDNKNIEKSAEKSREKVEFILRGRRSWNTRDPYNVNLSQEKLFADYEDLRRTFYFVSENAQEQAIHGDMKRAMFKFIRDPDKNIIEEYSEFIFKKMSQSFSGIAKNFDLPENKSLLFIYHLGISTLCKIILSLFQDSKTGSCFKLMTGNSVIKYMPSEFIKETAVKWHNEHIGNDIQFDSILEYNELKRVVSKCYLIEYEKYNKKLDDLIVKSNLNIGRSDRDQLFKKKWNDWFGKINIFVYNRFLERTIFKAVK